MPCYQMSENLAEKSIVSTVIPPVQLDNSQLVVQNDSGNYSPLDLEEYSYTNRELVNLENAAVNIENSSDVIIGPVTQFNVNGNVTIFQNGQEAIEDGTEQKEDTSRTDGKKYGAVKRYISSFNNLSRIKKFVAILTVTAIILLLIAVIITVMYLQLSSVSKDFFGEYLGTHRIYYRDDWGGVLNISWWELKHPTKLVIISHTDNNSCNSFESCSLTVRKLQAKDIANKWSDIGYNFLIGGDGNVYVGRGWDTVNFHPQFSIGISFIGNYARDNLTPDMIDVTLLLLEKGLDMEKLSLDYELLGHNQTTKWFPTSPGENVVKVIKNWKHYSDKILFKK